MSAPATNVVPAPIRTIASAAASPFARATPSSIASQTPGAERVDRRVVDGQDRDAILDFVVNELRHRNSSRIGDHELARTRHELDSFTWLTSLRGFACILPLGGSTSMHVVVPWA